MQALLSCLYLSHKPDLEKLSPQAFGANSRKDARRMLLKLVEETVGKLNLSLTSLMVGNWSLQRNDEGKTIADTFSPVSNVLDFCGILSASFSINMRSVAVACRICAQGFLEPKFRCLSACCPLFAISLYL